MEVQLNTKLFTDTHEVRPGVVIGISTNQKKPTWYLATLNGKWIQTSLGTTEFYAATDEAVRRIGNYTESGDSNALKSKRANRHTFKSVANEWLATQKLDLVNKTRTVEDYLIPFFEDTKKVRDWSTINKAMFEEYHQWRTDYWNSSIGLKRRRTEKALRKSKLDTPVASTLIREGKGALRQIISYAGRLGYFGKNPVPIVDLPEKDGQERPAFSKEQFNHLYKTAEAWVSETDDPKTMRRRQLLRDMIYVVRWTGVRPTHEPLQIRWCDLKLDIGYTQIAKATKTGERQASFLYVEAYHYLKAMRKRYEDYCALVGVEVDDTALVFQTLEGEGISDWAAIFRKLLVRADITSTTGDLPYTLYSLRHTFATEALLEQFPAMMIAKIMGTSMRMLEEHYAHLTSGAAAHWAKERAKQQQQVTKVEVPNEIKEQMINHGNDFLDTLRGDDTFKDLDIKIAFSDDWFNKLNT